MNNPWVFNQRRFFFPLVEAHFESCSREYLVAPDVGPEMDQGGVRGQNSAYMYAVSGCGQYSLDMYVVICRPLFVSSGEKGRASGSE